MALSIAIQPNQYGISMARSPIIYKYIGTTSTYDYQFELFLTTGTTAELFKYVSIMRTPDIQNSISIDAAMIIKQFLKDNMSFSTENVAYFQATMWEITAPATSGATISDIGIATMGYTKYTDGVNYTEQTTAVDYLMDNYLQTKQYPILDYTGTTFLSWRDNDVNTGYKIVWTNVDGSTGTDQASFGTISDAKDQIAKISFIASALTTVTTTNP